MFAFRAWSYRWGDVWLYRRGGWRVEFGCRYVFWRRWQIGPVGIIVFSGPNGDLGRKLRDRANEIILHAHRHS